LSQTQFDGVRAALKVDEASLWSILAVETRGFGFLDDRRPKILFERHIFSKRTKGRFDATAPDLSNPKKGGYSIGGAAEYERLNRAVALDRRAALESASWGLGQVMGFNAQAAGYTDVDAMITAFAADEDAQLEGAARFILSKPALAAAAAERNWARFAFFYNGSEYAKNKYDVHLKENYDTFTLGLKPNLEMRTAQACLTYLAYKPRGVDGLLGPGTQAALMRFQTDAQMEVTGKLDDATFEELRKRAGV
jgi:hypothetical protein